MSSTPYAIHPLVSGTKPVIAGESNPYSSDPRNAMFPYPENSAGGRFPGILGITKRKYLEIFERLDLCGERWSIRVARAAAEQVIAAAPPAVIMCGAKVSQAFGVKYHPCTVHDFGYQRTILVCIPHPSGLSRAWHDPAMAGNVRAILRECGVL